MKPPGRVHLGPLALTVSTDRAACEAAEVVYGEFRGRTSTILVNPEQSASNMRDTLLHEVLHAALDAAGLAPGHGYPAPLRTEAAEERLVRALTPWLLGMLRDNPRLVAFLLETED